MTLNKRYLRNIRSNLSFYIAASVLTMVSLLLFILFYISGTGIRSFGDEFFPSHHLEDATFTTYLPIPEEELEQLEQDYDVILEQEDYVNLKEGDTTVRLFRPTKKIDLYEVIEGRDLESDDDILISAGYAENMGVNVGDPFTVNGKTYTVCGYILRPDYCSALVEPEDSYKNITTFVFGYVTDAEFDRLDGAGSTIKVIYQDDSRISGFRTYINDNYITRSYLNADDSLRVSYVYDQADMFLIMSWILLIALPLVTVALIGVILSRKVKNEQRMIGTLSAMGYTRGRLTMHYVLLAAIPGLLGGILVTIAGLIFAQPYGELCLADYEPLTCTFRLPPLIALAGILIPTAIYMLAAYFTTHRLLKRNTVDLLNGSADGRKHLSRLLYKKDLPVRRKFGIRSLIGNPGRTFVLFLGIFLGAYIVALSFAFIDSITAIGTIGSEKLGGYQYEYVLNTLGTGEADDGEAMFAMSAEADNFSFSVIGADSDVSLWNITLTDGERADLDDGWYISSLLALTHDLSVGDSFTFCNKTSMEEYTITVQGIIDNDFVNYAISSRQNLYDLFDLDTDYYNVILAGHSLDLDSSIVAETLEAGSIQDQVDAMLDEMNMIIYSLTVIGLIICVAAVYISVNMVVTENRVNISMLRVLGLRDREINRMVLNGGHILLIPGIALGIWLAVESMGAASALYAQMESTILPKAFSITHGVLTVVLVVLCYFGSMALVRRKANRVDMVESLKDNRQ